MNGVLKQIERFHGHLGPYVVIGYKMGEIANKKLGCDSFSKKAIIWTGPTPPLSCIIDGIQMSSGCTLGKGNIIIHSGKIPKVKFSNGNGKHIEIKLKKDIQNEINTNLTQENMIHYSEQLYNKSDQELFEIL